MSDTKKYTSVFPHPEKWRGEQERQGKAKGSWEKGSRWDARDVGIANLANHQLFETLASYNRCGKNGIN
eukprot:414152-Pelagomonas_calceolata.AAC.2